MEKRTFLAFIAMVINCASEIETKSRLMIKIVDAAKAILGITDVKGDDMQGILEKGFGGSRTPGI